MRQQKLLAVVLVVGGVAIGLAYGFRNRDRAESFQETAPQASAGALASTVAPVVDSSLPLTPPEPASATRFVVISKTPTGWLNVREGSGTTYARLARVNPGERFELVEERSGWYKIKLTDGREGWVASEYAAKE